MDTRPARSDLTDARGASTTTRGLTTRGSAKTPSLRTLKRIGDPAAESLLVHGDNLRALAALRPSFERAVRCVYLDPPFNTGRTFAEYDDTWEEGSWSAMIRPRLEAIAPLLADDAAVFVEIDDTQLAELLLAMDDVFGAKNRISTITVVRSAPTGHKAINRGPVHVSDFLLAYAKDRRRWRYRPQVRVRDDYDHAYGTWLENPDASPRAWRFVPLKAKTAERLGFASSHDASKKLGSAELGRRSAELALDHPRHVVRFAQPRYEAIGRAAQRVVDRSKADRDRVIVLEREGLPPFIVRGGNRILFLVDKVREIEGRPSIVEPLTNVWHDVPFQGISREGGVVFSRNKKPERLVARVVAMASDPGDWVLDPFLGSGTTAAVAHKMGRRFIGIERGEHLTRLAEPRLTRVVRGEDPTGITSSVGFTGGGGFRVAEVR